MIISETLAASLAQRAKIAAPVQLVALLDRKLMNVPSVLLAHVPLPAAPNADLVQLAASLTQRAKIAAPVQLVALLALKLMNVPSVLLAHVPLPAQRAKLAAPVQRVALLAPQLMNVLSVPLESVPLLTGQSASRALAAALRQRAAKIARSVQPVALGKL